MKMKRFEPTLISSAIARLWWCLFGASACTLLCLAAVGAILAQVPRTLTPDDLFKIEKIEDVAISPDGQTVAYVRKRPRLSGRVVQQEDLFGKDFGDIWLAPVLGGTPMNLTHGETDGGGWWAPTWSPDGEHLAMMSTKGGDNVRLWVWEKATGRLTKLSDRGVLNIYVTPPALAWLDDHRAISVLLPEGERPWRLSYASQTSETIMREWPKARAGRESTASVLDSGVSAEIKARQQMQLTILDIRGGNQPVASVADWAPQIDGVPFQIAPDGRHISFFKLIAMLPPSPARLVHGDGRFGWGGARYQVSIADASGRVVMDEAKGVWFVALDSFRWSRDGQSYAFIGVKKGDDEDSLRVFRGDVNGSIQVVPLPDYDPRAIVWASGNSLLVRAECKRSGADAAVKKRLDWWLVTSTASPRNLTEKLKTSPEDLVADPTGGAFVGVADGDLWHVKIDSGEWRNLTASFAPKVGGIVWNNNSFVWINNSASHETGFSQVVVSVPRSGLTDYYWIDVASGAMTAIGRPSDSAELVAYRSDTNLALFVAEERTGTYLTVVHGGEHRPLVEINTFLRDIAEGEPRMIKYWSLDGKELKAWLILPTNYQNGKKYPLVTWVYAGRIMGDKPYALTRLNLDHFLNLQLLSARGYAVLLPSMPLKTDPVSDPLLELTKGVLPAVDKAIELGIADPQRLAVMGHSYGGYSTYGLVTQTNRFKAAISLAGFSDLTSIYGTFDARSRYQPYAHEVNGQQFLAETGQNRMGNPPWKDLGRYLRNSPIFYVERVETPLLIVQGDMDYEPIQQGEEFFAALYRQDKRSRFVRYWGEGHIFSSPANIRDFWNRAYAWLDEFCDISRDEQGNLEWDGDKVKFLNGAPPLRPEDFARFDEMELRSHPWVNKSVNSKR